MKMVRLIIPAVLFLIASCSTNPVQNSLKTEQLYKGYSNNGSYLCYLKILPGNKVIFTYQTEENDIYGEHSGTIKANDDSTYHISCKLTFGEFVCKPINRDSLWILVNPPSLIDKNAIQVQYENEELMAGRKTSKSGITFVIDDQLFNEYTPASILTDHLHPITGEALTIKASYGCAYDFVRGDKLEFDIVISGDSLYSIGNDTVLQTGDFKLKKQ
jgi:hypothetical protein